jgi:hypothetical protein
MGSLTKDYKMKNKLDIEIRNVRQMLVCKRMEHKELTRNCIISLVIFQTKSNCLHQKLTPGGCG